MYNHNANLIQLHLFDTRANISLQMAHNAKLTLPAYVICSCMRTECTIELTSGALGARDHAARRQLISCKQFLRSSIPQ
eukprot:3314924-Heterocapsa_arctica.AAC.1